MNETVVSAAYDLFLVLLPVLAAALGQWFFRMAGTERIKRIKHEMDTKYSWAWDAVKATEQRWWEKAGSEKYRIASEALAAIARKNKVPIAGEEIRVLIESAVKAMKNEMKTVANK